MAVRKKQMEEDELKANSTQEDMETSEAEKDTVEEEERKDAAGHPPRAVAKKEEKVGIKLFRDNEKYKDPLFVGVNGRSYLIERGVPVMVPKSVAEVIDNSENQLMYLSEVQKKLENVEYKELN